jgi:predicted nucleic acid-binding Zn ribbon protein
MNNLCISDRHWHCEICGHRMRKEITAKNVSLKKIEKI